MAISGTTTFKLTVSRKPGILDIRYAVKKNDVSGGPIPTDGPSAEEWNQISETLAAIAATARSLCMSVVNGASPAIQSFECVRDDLTSASFTLYSPGTGICEITWAADVLPVMTVLPKVTINGTTPGVATTELMENGVRIHTFDMSSSPTYLDFTVDV